MIDQPFLFERWLPTGAFFGTRNIIDSCSIRHGHQVFIISVGIMKLHILFLYF
jgi:hypothetical protein